MAEVNKHLEKADRLLQKGKLEGALEEFLLAWKMAPSNDTIVITVAELYQRLNRVKESRECYVYMLEKAAEKKDGQKVLELIRKMQVLGPIEPARLIMAAQLVEKQRPDLAGEQYKRALEAVGEQNLEVSLQCLQGLARLQPGSLELQRRISATAVKLGNKSVAIAAYQRLAEMLLPIGKWDEAIESLEQVCVLVPSNVAAQVGLARACVQAGRFARVVELWKGAEAQTDNRELLGLLAQAYLAEKELDKAEALYWKLLEGSAEAPNALLEIAQGYLQQENISPLLRLLKTLEDRLSQQKPQKEMIVMVEKFSRLEHSHSAVLEPLSYLLDRLHLDSPLASALNTLFDLYYAAREFRKAAETLERLIAVDPYNPESTAKLEQLQGRVEASLLRELGSRMGLPAAGSEAFAATAADGSSAALAAAEASSAPSAGGNPLKDLMLQAEIFLQYGMQEKCRERLERIAKLFPREEEKNEELRSLYEKTGFTVAHPAGAAAPAGVPPESPDFRADLKRVSEISRNLSRQGTVKAVLFAAVNDIGRFWQVSRCVAGLATPNRPPSMAMEYISPGVAASDAVRLGKLVMGLQQANARKNFPLVAENVKESPQLVALQETLAALQVESLVAIPLRDGDQEIGILVLEQCGQRRSWKGNDLAGLEALAEQVVLAVANVRLRNLMKALAVTDERSGLLHRDSYLTCLMSEAERMRTQKTPLTVVLLQFSQGDKRGPDSKKGKGLEEFIQKFSGSVMSHLRQNDIAIKYGPRTLALILPGATGKDATVVTEKMRKLTVTTAASNAEDVPQVIAGIAEAIREGGMDSTDRVTELINRLEWALDATQQPGADAIKLLEPPAVS